VRLYMRRNMPDTSKRAPLLAFIDPLFVKPRLQCLLAHLDTLWTNFAMPCAVAIVLA
jgi:hypothetical protein